jgi:hypothetical protein
MSLAIYPSRVRSSEVFDGDLLLSMDSTQIEQLNSGIAQDDRNEYLVLLRVIMEADALERVHVSNSRSKCYSPSDGKCGAPLLTCISGDRD